MIIVATVSILGLSLLVWLANRFLPFKICPICAGVSGTWIWLMAGYFMGYQIDPIIPAMLMGGSVVGLAYQLEKKLSPDKSQLLWKTLCIPAGFILAYSILFKEWLVFSVILVFLLVIIYLFFSKDGNKQPDRKKIEDLKNKMDKCC